MRKNYKLKAKIILDFGSQALFAKVLGVSEDRISRLIHGRSIPKDEEKTEICKLLGSNPQELFPNQL